jgi:uncharacterized protein DUF4124
VICSVPAFAETYTWEDDQGTINFTEDLGKVPKKYRKKARIIGEEEPSTAEVKEEKVPPAMQPKESSQGDVSLENKKSAPTSKLDNKAMYGEKDGAAWKSEFAAMKADVKAAEDQLVANRNRLKDISAMSREEYLTLQDTIRSNEKNVLGLRKKFDELKKEAESAGVPAELME